MAKRKISENSLKNLEKANPENNFNNSDIARKAQEKSVEKRLENKLLKQAAEEKLNKLYADGKTFQEKSLDLMEEMVLTGILKPTDLISLLTFLRDTSGQKPTDKQEISGSVGVQKVFITENEHKETLQHIEDVINEQ